MLQMQMFRANLFRWLRSLLPICFRHLDLTVFQCQWQKLPNSIEVSWFRDGRFIVGQVNAGEYKFMTQGRNAKEFIEMVNDALLAVYEVPEDYLDIFLRNRKYQPDSYQMSLLTNKEIKGAEFGIKKMELAHN